jgi:O-succinylbenzoate synthase
MIAPKLRERLRFLEEPRRTEYEEFLDPKGKRKKPT